MSQRKKTVSEERQDIFMLMYGVKTMGSFNKRTQTATPNSVLEKFEADYNRYKNKGINKVLELYREYSYAIFFMYSPSSIRNNLVAFRNVIKNNGGKYQSNALEAFTIENVYAPITKESVEHKREQKEKIQKGENETIDPSVIEERIQAFKHELNTKSYSVGKNQKEEQVRAYRIVAMLGMATGRRFTELLKTLDVSKRGKKITFKGLLKGNDKEIEGHIISLSYKEVKAFLEELRAFAQTEELSEQEVNAKYAKVFNNAMKRLGVTNVKATRHNYSIAGAKLFHREGETIEDTVTRILGHRENLTSSLNYT